MEYQDEAYEALCKRCGVCCGSQTSDPCANLVKLNDGTYSCKVYETRHGPQSSVSGKMFACVNIRDVIKSGAYYPDCPYCKGSG
ncbi:MAG: hypothetical protein JXB40_06390 [Candidatus Omnitrophica bacterium]|nr:hypothetical protein [Candidatus Omnitrophota bacterium]